MPEPGGDDRLRAKLKGELFVLLVFFFFFFSLTFYWDVRGKLGARPVGG